MARVGFARLSERVSFLLGEKNIISAGNLRMRKGRIVPLMVVLTLTLSSTIAFTVQARSFEADIRSEVAYAVGADLRVTCTPHPFSFATTIESYPGVVQVTPVLMTWGQVGLDEFTVVGVDAIDYAQIANFDSTSFNGEDPVFVLSRLASIANAIVVSEALAARWDKRVGDFVLLQVGGRTAPVQQLFYITGIVHSAPGLGLASVDEDTDGDVAFGLQVPRSAFVLTNLGFISSITDITTASLFLGDLVCVADRTVITRALSDLPGVSATTPETFNLKSHSFATALFLSTVEGLFSIGFAMSMVLSLFALTLFLGSIVRERRRDYAILRAVGSSRRQVIVIVMSEFAGTILASLVLSLVLGTVFGFIQSVIVFALSPATRILPAAISFPVEFLTMVLVVQVLVMTAAAYFPALDAARTDPAVVLRNL